ncbi:MAG: hypothetical protein AB8B55_13485 [Mariniblastus sp.]
MNSTARQMEPLSEQPHDIGQVEPKEIGVEEALEAGWIGIVFAGGIYGFSVSLLVVGYFTVRVFLFGESFFKETLVGLAVGTLAGFIIALISSLMSLLFVYVLKWTFANQLSWRTAVCVLGGLSGFLPFAADLYWMPFSLPPFSIHTGCVLAFAAMTFGHVGAIAFVRVQISVANNLPTCANRFRFGTGHIMVVMFWLSFVFALDNFLPNQTLVLNTLFYVVAQGVLLAADNAFVRWSQRRSN